MNCEGSLKMTKNKRLHVYSGLKSNFIFMNFSLQRYTNENQRLKKFLKSFSRVAFEKN